MSSPHGLVCFKYQQLIALLYHVLYPRSNPATAMSSPTLDISSSDTAPATATISHSDRIRELSAIDADVTSLLRSAGLAVQSLTAGIPTASASSSSSSSQPTAHLTTEATNDTIMTDTITTTPQSAADIKGAFDTHNESYLKTVQAVQAVLRRQAYALEEAGIVPAKQAEAWQRREGEEKVTNGGMGGFDVGWLNSRRDEVGRLKELELWREARGRLERAVGEDEGMDVEGGGG